MKLCAQLYSLRQHAQTPDDIRKTVKICSDMGYEGIQASGIGEIAPEELARIARKYHSPVVCTHVPFERIVDDTEKLIEEHKIYKCDVIGLGSMPTKYRGSAAGLEEFLKIMEEPVKKIEAAGLKFSYHNHAFEFDLLDDGRRTFDVMLERCPNWLFLLDTYWVEFAGCSAIEYMRKVGSARLRNIHYKDMARDEKRSICACGDGVLDFASITEVCRELDVENVIVEQDNAFTAFPDAFEQMRRSFNHLRGIV